MAEFQAQAFICGWYHGGMRDFHLTFMKENAPPGAISIVRINDDRAVNGIVQENRRFGAAEVHVMRTRGPVLRTLSKLLPIFAVWALVLVWRARARGIFVSHDGFCFWAVPSLLLRRVAHVFAHDPAPHQTAEASTAAWIRRRYFRFIYYRKRWKAVVVGSESNRGALEAGGCASPVLVRPFPVFGAELFDLAPPRPTPEIAGLPPYLLFFGRVDVYKGVHDWLSTALGRVDRPVVIAGRVIDRRVLDFAGRAVLIDRFIENGEVGGLFRGARALICPYSSATHSGIVDLGLSYGLPVYVTRIPYFQERYARVPGVRWIEDLPADLAADPSPHASPGASPDASPSPGASPGGAAARGAS